MVEKLDLLLAELSEVRRRLEDKPEPVSERILRIVEKVLVPVLLGALTSIVAYGQLQVADASSKISDGQLELARQTFRRTMQTKYVEIIYKELTTGDSKAQLKTIKLIRHLDEEVANQLAAYVEEAPQIAKEVVESVATIKRELALVGPLNGYKIALYYYRDDPMSEKRAQSAEAQIRKAGFTGILQPSARDDNFFNAADPPKAIEIRYDAGIEDDAANALLSILAPGGKQNNVVTAAITRGRTPNFVSVFFPRGQ